MAKRMKRSGGGDALFLYGTAPVEAALRARRRSLQALWFRPGRDDARVEEIVELAREAGVDVHEADGDALAERARTRIHQGLVLRCGALPLLDLRALLELPLRDDAVILALDQVEDPQNLGGLVRCAAFLGADAVLLHRARRAPLSPTVSKASAGTLESFRLAESGNLADALLRLGREGWRIVGSALDDAAVDHRRLEPNGRTVLVMGNEGAGIRTLTARRCDTLVRIGRRGEAESLNVTVAAGVLLDRLTAGREDVD